MNILYTTTIGGTMGFFKSLIPRLVSDGNSVDIATNNKFNAIPTVYNDLSCNVFQIDWSRSPLAKGNISAIRQLRKVIADNDYDIVHCHTPICAACTRIACRPFRNKGLKVIYTAHGFHFYKGAPIKNWLIYFPIEWICSFFTDVLITINTEDFEFAKKHLHAKRKEFVPGVGLDLNKFSKSLKMRDELRSKLEISDDEQMLLSVGELSDRKNHLMVIDALAQLNDDYKYKYYIVGGGPLDISIREHIKSLGMDDKICLLGWRNDVNELCSSADLFVFPSKQEGFDQPLSR